MKNRPKPGIFSLLLLTSLGTLLAVLFTPAFPEIAKKLQISAGMTQMTMTLFLVGYALGNLPYGPLANRYGRKPTLLVGIGIAFIGSLMAAIVPSYPSLALLLSSRFLMGLGGGVGIKIATTMIGDSFSEQESRRITPYIVLSFAVVPAIAIYIGGVLTQRLGWESCLYFLVAYCAFQFAISLFLPETAKQLDPNALNSRMIGEKYLQESKNKTVLLCSLLLGFGTSFIYVFASESPFIGIEHLGLSPELFGALNFVPSIGMVIGSLLARFAAEKYTAIRMMRLGALISFGGSLLMLLLFWSGFISTYTLFLPMPLIYLGLSLIFANALALGISQAKDKGTASAVLNFLNIWVSVVLLGIVAPFSGLHLMAMPLIFAVSSTLLLALSRTLSHEL